jgi:superfamily II DNA or RNA helicase
MDDDYWKQLDQNLVSDELADDLVVTDEIKPSLYTPDKSDKKIIITKTGAFIKYEYLGLTDELSIIKAVRKIENYFTLRTLQLMGNFKQSKRCKVDREKRRIIVPRFGVYEILNKKYNLIDYTTVSQIKPGESPTDLTCLTWCAQLTPNQKLIAEYIMNHIYTKQRLSLGSAGLILNLEAGQGKSFLAAYLISVIKKRAAIILHSTSMIEQWIKVIQTCFPTVSIGVYYGKKKTRGDIQLLIVDSACSDIFKFGNENQDDCYTMTAIEFYNQFGLIIFDECHEYCNNHDAKVFKYAQAPYMLGLSATPDENANKWQNIIYWDIGPVLLATDVPGYEATLNDFKGIVHRIMYYGNVEYTKFIKNEITDMTSTAETISMICEDPYRNELIIKCIKECMDKELFTYVFADRREFLERLKELLKKESINGDSGEIVTNDDEFIRLVGGSKAKDLETAEIKSRVIFTTFAYGGTGRSIIKMNGLVFATPRKSRMKQTVGRILRLGSDQNITRHIYDIVDQKLNLKNQWSERLKYYRRMNFAVNEKKVSFTEFADIVEKSKVIKPKVIESKLDEVDETKVKSKVIKPKVSKLDEIDESEVKSKVIKSKVIKSKVTAKVSSKESKTDESRVKSKVSARVSSKESKTDESKVSSKVKSKVNANIIKIKPDKIPMLDSASISANIFNKLRN